MDKLLGFVLGSVVNWKTTIMGVVVLIGSVGALLSTVALALAALFDGDPSTAADWSAIGVAFAQVSIGFGLIFSKDSDKSTEDVKRGQG